MAPLKEATIRPSRRSVGILNSAIATIKETPLPVKLLTIGIGAVTTASILSSCDTKSPPCEILPTDTPDQEGGFCPLTIYAYNQPEKVLSPEDQAAYYQKYGANVSTIYQWYAVNKGSNAESVGDGLVAFTTYYFENGKSVVVFPSADDNYFSEKAEKHEFKTSLLETSDGKILKSYNYSGENSDELDSGNPISFVTIEYDKPDGVTLADIAANQSLLGNPTSLIISNPPAKEEIAYNVDPNNTDDQRLIEAIASWTGAGVAHALGEGTAIAPPTEGPTAIPTAVPIEVAPGEFLQPSQIVGYEARDNSGKLIYVQDTHGVWIKASHEVTVAPPTEADWTNLNTRLGPDFAINTDGTITGVEGLNINQNGEVTFNFDGKGPETYHIANIKVQDGKLLMAGYMWNADTKSWDTYDPGFQLEDPSIAGWFIEADSANGNWLRWHQRNNKGLDIESLLDGSIQPDSWGPFEVEGSKRDITGSVVHYNKLDWHNSNVREVNGNKKEITKGQYPGWAGLSYGYMVDSGCVLISFDALNGDGSITSLPMILDDILWKEHRDSIEFTRTALAGGHEWDASMEKEAARRNSPEFWMFWPDISVFSDATVSSNFGQEDIVILQDPQGIARREATIKDDVLLPSASLELWGASVYVNNP